MRVITIAPGESYHVREITGDLASLQAEVGGVVEVIWHEGSWVIVADEDARRKGLGESLILALWGGINRSIVGPIVIVGIAGEDFADLSDDDLDWWKQRLQAGEA